MYCTMYCTLNTYVPPETDGGVHRLENSAGTSPQKHVSLRSTNSRVIEISICVNYIKRLSSVWRQRSAKRESRVSGQVTRRPTNTRFSSFPSVETSGLEAERFVGSNWLLIVYKKSV